MEPSSLIIVGKIIKPHGINGEVIVQSLCDSPGFYKIGRRLITFPAERGQADLIISNLRRHQGRIILQLEGIATRNEAEALRNLDLYTERTNLAPPDPDEFYHFEIVGAAVLDTLGQRLGTVHAILEVGTRFLLEITTPRKRFLLPFEDDFIQAVHRDRGEVIIRDYHEFYGLEP